MLGHDSWGVPSDRVFFFFFFFFFKCKITDIRLFLRFGELHKLH